MKPVKLALLGCGNMGSAIALGLARQSRRFQFYYFDPQLKKSSALAKQTKGKTCRRLAETKMCDYFLIACKPRQFAELACELEPLLPAGAKIISIMAGISTKTIAKKLGVKKIARVMPNTPALVNEGAIGIYFSNMTVGEKKIVQKIFAAVGEVQIVRSDKEIDLITIGTGSGPAYIFEIARILINQLVRMGLSRTTAEPMVQQMIKGSAFLMQKSSNSPEELRNQVTSKGGTTEAALKTLKKNHLEKILQKALNSAYQRAKILGA